MPTNAMKNESDVTTRRTPDTPVLRDWVMFSPCLWVFENDLESAEPREQVSRHRRRNAKDARITYRPGVHAHARGSRTCTETQPGNWQKLHGCRRSRTRRCGSRVNRIPLDDLYGVPRLGRDRRNHFGVPRTSRSA